MAAGLALLPTPRIGGAFLARIVYKIGVNGIRTALLSMTISLAPVARGQSCSADLDGVGHGHADRAQYAERMDRVSLQKAALAVLVRAGIIVDYGCGSGALARDTAMLLADSTVIGVDLDPGMIEYARRQPHPDNVSYRVGNATVREFANESVDTILLSATMHHLPAYGQRRFDVAHVHEAIDAIYDQLKFGGHFVLRDFIYPEGPDVVHLDLPSDDGLETGEVTKLSTAALFRVFARDFRSAQHPDRGVDYALEASPRPGWERFRVDRRDATEFIHHKDYRDNWAGEIREPFMLFTQNEIDQILRDHGFRLLHSTLISNDWIVDNRFVGKFRMTGPDGKVLPFPPTGFGLAAQKIAPTEGARFERTAVRTPQTPFLQEIAMRHLQSGRVYDIVHRPYTAVDVLPYFRRGGRVYVLSKQGFPRPLLAKHGARPLGGSRGDGYVAEPIGFIRRGDAPLFTEVERELERRGGVRPDQILTRGPRPDRYFYPSPGMISEVVRSVAVPIRSRPTTFEIPHDNYSGFASSGSIRPMEATQVLRGSQLGSSLDARLEIGIYHLLYDLEEPLGPWIGDAIAFPDENVRLPVTSARGLLNPKRRHRRFEEAPREAFGNFLEVFEGRFAELDLEGREIASAWREFVEPRTFGKSVISILPVIKNKGRVYVGLETRDLPAVQMHQGFSTFTALPAWRIPKRVPTLPEAKRFARRAIDVDFRVRVERLRPLGGAYHPSVGLSDEIVHPYVAKIDADSARAAKLSWVAFEDLLRQRDEIRDANLLTSLFRLAHALGLGPLPAAR